MRNLIKIFVAFLFVFGTEKLYSQDCESIVNICKTYLNKDTKGNKFVSDGQVYTAFLDREKAEFKTTFFGGTIYRIVASAGKEDNFVIFSIKDELGNVLFTNKNHKNSPYWDFKVNSTIPIIIETELDMDKKVTGCTVMLIGFNQNK